MLKSLTPRDRFNLACMDVECDWAFEKATAADEKNIEAARQFLDRRMSLGWTDLEKAFASAFERAGKGTRIIYIGDGIPTVGDGEAAGVSARLVKLFEEKCRGKGVVCYTVSSGSTFESGVLKTIAGLGGGSMRQITGEQGPRVVAFDLLKEITRPAISNLKVQFSGVRVARVYPEQLPNLSAGSQQIMLGRYLPQGAEQSGEIVVSGRQGEKDVQFKRAITIKDAEEGNSFIPRLWARMHLDHLLQQGPSESIKDDIIALSEEYHIITPYTSLLVLETDADRERFKVKRSFQMRDGEKFFAERRDNTNFELVQQQMKRAGTWRLGLRKSVLQQLSGLGRDANVIPQPQVYSWPHQVNTEHYRRLGVNIRGGNGRWADLGVQGLIIERLAEDGVDTLGRNNRLANSNLAYQGEDFDSRIDLFTSLVTPDPSLGYQFARSPSMEQAEEREQFFGLSEFTGVEKKREFTIAGGTELAQPEFDGRFGISRLEVRKLGQEGLADVQFSMGDVIYADRKFRQLERGYQEQFGYDGASEGAERVNYDVCKRVYETHGKEVCYTVCQPVWDTTRSRFVMVDRRRVRPSGVNLDGLFGWLPSVEAVKTTPPKAKDWPEEARTISKNLLRTAQLQSADGGLKIASEMQAFDPRFGDVIAKCRGEFLTGAKSWLLCLENDGQPMTIEWCDGRERAVMTAAFQLGRVRGTVAEDLKMPPWQDGSFALWSLEERFAEQKVAIEHPTADQTLLIFTHPDDKTGETRVLVDTKRNVVLSIEHRRDGKTTDVHTFSDFVEAAGAWWVGKIESRDEKGRVVGVKTQRVARLEGDALAKAIESELAGREKAQFLRDPARNVIEAKKALKENKADFDDQVTLVMHFAFSQQWTRAMEHLDAAEKLAAGKPGMRWLRYQLLKASRRNEELKNAILKEAEELIGKPVPGPVPDDDLILHLRSDYSELAHPRADAWYLDNYLLGQASGVLENNERLTMLDTLRPVFAAQPEYRLAMKQWKQQRADLLGNCGRGDEALLLIRELAESYPRDFGAQMKYLQAMQGRQEFALVRKEIERRLASDVPWEPEEIYQFRSMFADTLRAEERYEELTGYLKQWIEQNPDRNEPYYQYLDALLYVDRVEDAYALSETWFEDGRRNDVAPAAAARVWAAAMWILADNHWNGYGTGKDRSFWERQLSETVVFFARHEKLFSLSEWIIHNNEFWQTEAGVKARAQRRKIFEENFDRLSVAEIERFVGWLPNEGSDAEKQIWKGYARRLEERALAETDVERKYRLLKAAGNFVAYCGNSGEYIAMLRKIVAEVPEKHRGEFISLLFDTLLNQAWSQDYENEAFELLDKLQKGATPAEQTIERIRALHRIDDRMLQTRREAKNAAIEHPEKLTRTELAAKQAENARKAMEEYAERLAREEAKHPAPLATWMAAERVWLDVQLNRNLEQAAEFCWKTLDAKLPTIDENSAAAAVVQAAIDHALRNRCLVMAMNLTVRKNSAPQAIRRLMDFLDQNIAREIAEDTKSQQWKLLKYEMLIALDRPAELEKTLDEWIRAGDADNRWRTALGYVQAEQGKLKEAIATFEAVKAADELGSAEYRALGDWYQAENRREDYEKSKEQIYKTMPEGEIEQFLNGQMQPWLNPDGARPSELNREVLWAFQNVLAKSGDPARFIGGPLRSLYGACRDFRLLASLADSVPGHTAGQIYPFLRSARTVIDEIRDEAAVDSLTARIVELRGKAATEVDRRAFDLLEAMVERRASELKNQPGPHVEKAVAALRQASKREWSAGEQRLMAEFLADLGVVNQEKFSAEQMRQIEQFYLSAKAGSQERLDMACIWARSLWGHGRRQAAIDVLESEVRQYLPPTGEANTPGTANYRKRLSDQPIFADYLSYLQQEGQFETAVNQVQAQLDRETAEAKRNDLTIQIFEVERAALRDGGHVAGFEGEKLYRRLQEEILARLPSGNSPFDARLITTLSALYSEAHNRQIAAAAGDLRTYAFGKFHELLKRQIAQNEALVNDLCERVHQLCGPADGIAFLLDCRDRRPRWLRIRQNFWDAHGSQLTAWRKEAGKLDPALTERLLAVVLEQLRDGLLGRHGYNLPICYDNCPAAFWAEKEGDFLRTAEEVYAANENSAPIILNVADYLVQGLSRLDRAIEMLRAANDEKLLDENGQLRLVDYLQRRDRYGESIALLQSLVERSPHNLDYCGRLIAAYFYTNRRADLFELLRKTEDWFRTHDGWHWNEDTMAITAESCVQCNGGDPDLRRDLLAQALKYYEVLIPLHERNHPQLGAADGQLSHYYSNKSKCYAVLKKTFEAADAAYSAVVCWGPDANNRKAALETLRNVLRGADDLDAYVVKLDEQSAKAGQQNAVVRKALGQVFAERGQYDKAMVQLRIACDVQPDDREIRQAMIDCCDRLKDKHEAIAQVIELVKLARRDINLYKDLGRRFADLNDAHESERAYTSIVEVLASEAESHAMLAEVRESQNRFAEAIAEWRQVARLRALEPTGLLRLARAQIHEKQWKDAAETLRQLGAKVWPPRFDKLDAEILELKFKIWGGQGSETR
jgi:tetratricopeptide (TPR) repeat protein